MEVLPGEKKCTKCGEIIPATLEYFYKRKGSKDGLTPGCRLCIKESRKKHQKKYRTTERGKEVRRKFQQSKNYRATCRKYRLKRSYNLTPDQHLKIYADQNGCCAICKKSIAYSEVHTDHSHDTGKVRGLLCVNCNLYLGIIEQKGLFLKNALEYLKNYEK